MRSLCLVLALALLPAGCEQPTATPRKRLVFSYAEGGALKEQTLRRLVEEFERGRKDVDVFLHPLPPSTDEQRNFYLSSLAARSSFVDLFESDVIWTAELAAAGLLLDLSDTASLRRPERFVPTLVEQARYDGRFYGVPYYGTFGALFYRPDLLKKHGLKLPLSLGDLARQAKKVGEAEGIHGLLFPAGDYEGLACVFWEIYACNAEPVRVVGERIALDPAATRSALRFLHDALHRHGITPTKVLSQIEADQTEAFARGEAVFMRGWRGAYPYLRERLSQGQVGVTDLPLSRGLLSGGFLLAVNRRTEVRTLAIALAQHLTAESAQRALAEERGQAPALASLYTDERGPGRSAVPKRALRNAVIRPRSPYYFELSQIVTEEVRAVLEQERDLEQGAERLVRRARKLRLTRRAAPGFPKTSYMTRYRP